MATPTIVLELDSDEPVYVQIARRIREQVGAGNLGPGAQLPPVRALASNLGVNLNTVARAYRMLEDEGFIRIRNRSGAVVAPPPASPARGEEERLRAAFRELLFHMRQTGLSPQALRHLVESEVTMFLNPGSSRQRRRSE